MALRAVLAFGVLLLLGPAAAWTAPDPGARYTPDERAWFQSLRTPDGRVSCCDLADCREVGDERTGENGQLEVFVTREQHWVPVPESAVLHGKNNILGRPVVCYLHRITSRGDEFTVLCYVPGFGA